MSPATRVRPPRQETRQRILAAAREVFAEKGVGATSVEDIVDAAGYTRGAFYSSFANKDDLLLAVISDQLQEQLAALTSSLERERTVDGLMRVLTAPNAPEWSSREDMLLAEELWLRAQYDDDLRSRLATVHHDLRVSLTATIAATCPDAPLPADVTATVVLALANGLVRASLLDRRVDGDALFADQALPLLLGARRPRRRRSGSG